MKRQVRELKAARKPKAYAAGALCDGDRIFFLQKRTPEGKVELELPGTVVFEGDDPVFCVKAKMKQKAGIDCEVGAVVFEGKYNAGSKKHKAFVPAMAFECRAKDCTARPSAAYCGIKWVKKEKTEIRKEKIARNSEWLLAAMA